MNEIVKVFNDRPVRIINLDGEPWFVAKDVCNILEVARVDSAIRALDADEKDTHSMSTLRENENNSITTNDGTPSVR